MRLSTAIVAAPVSGYPPRLAVYHGAATPWRIYSVTKWKKSNPNREGGESIMAVLEMLHAHLDRETEHTLGEVIHAMVDKLQSSGARTICEAIDLAGCAVTLPDGVCAKVHGRTFDHCLKRAGMSELPVV